MISEIDRNSMRQMRRIGHSITEIVDFHKVSRSTVHRHVHDIPVRCKSGPRRRVNWRTAISLRASGLTYREVAKRLGCGLGRVHAICKQAERVAA